MKSKHITQNMPDQPTSNASRITAMLQDLADARTKQTPTAPPNLPTRPTTPATPPANIPTSQPPVNTPPPATQSKPVAPMPVVNKPPQQRAPIQPSAPMGAAPLPKPTTPPPTPPVKTAPSIPVQTRPSTPPPTPPQPKPAQNYATELRTMKSDIGQISTGQAPLGSPQKPIPTPKAETPKVEAPKPPVPAPTITVPGEEVASGGSKKNVYVVVLGIILIGFGAYYFLFRDTASDDIVTSITPSPSESSAPLGRALTVYFNQSTEQSVELSADGTAQGDFLAAFGQTQPISQRIYRMPITGPFTATLGELLGGMDISVPDELKTSLGTDWVVLSYGQSEHFDASGQLIPGAGITPRLVMISAVQDVTAANQAMRNWENIGFANTILDLAGFDRSKASSDGFLDGSYRQMAMRYLNYPYADQSIDYAMVLASNGRNYLVISTSRESMFHVIDQLLQ